jgi:hypothetical protein
MRQEKLLNRFFVVETNPTFKTDDANGIAKSLNGDVDSVDAV